MVKIVSEADSHIKPEVIIIVPENASNHPKRKRGSNAPPKMSFINSDCEAMYSNIKKNLLPGTVVSFESQLHTLHALKNARLDKLCLCDSTVAYYLMIGEFYCNLEEKKTLDGKMFFRTMVNNVPFIVDDELLCNVLNLPPSTLNLPSYNESVFNKKDFHEYLRILCDSSVPAKIFDKEVCVSSMYFTQSAQFLALIYRTNIAPKLVLMKFDKYYNINDLKFLHAIITNKFHFNVPYFVLKQMIRGNRLGYMPYGLFLTELFKYKDSNLTGHSHFSVPNKLSCSLITGKLSLSDYVSFDKHGSKKPVKQGDNEQFALKFQEHDLKISGIEENLKKSKKQLAVELSLLTITVSGLLRRRDYLETVLGIRSKDEGRSNVMTTISPGPWTGDLGDVIRGPGSNEPAGGSYVSMMTDGSAVVVPTHMGLPTPTHLPPPNN